MRRGALLVGLLMLVALAVPASAATSQRIGQFAPLTGTATNYTTTMTLEATGFPVASVTSDSRAGQVGPQTGATTWFGADTPPGAVFGSSQDQPYINLRPRIDSSTPSTTTYTFERPTPSGGWGFVLGDIDADEVTVSAVTAAGQAATATQLGFQGTFNPCDVTPRASGCSTSQVKDQPTWNSATRTLTGNVGATDTYGASGWFRPTTSLRSLSLRFTSRSGFPVYQTWFGVTRQDVTGGLDLTAGTCDLGGATINLLDASGTVVESTTTSLTGIYSFTGVAASDGYQVELTGLAADCIADGPTSVAVDLRTGDDTAGFDVRELIPVPISGQVLDDDGTPLAGVTVTISGVGPTRTATTDSSGRYLFDTNDPGAYALSATLPSGYTLVTAPPPPTVPTGSSAPIVDRDFVLQAPPSVTGTVTGGGGAIGGVVVVLADGGTEVARAVTTASGGYTFPSVPAGTYTVAVLDPPTGYTSGSASVTVGTTDVTDVDLALSRPGSISGTVVGADGNPAGGVTVVVDGPGAPTTLTTDTDGAYALAGLSPGTYSVTVSPPGGTVVSGPTTSTVTITAAGESRGGVDFALAAAAAPTPTPTTPTDVPPVDVDGASDDGGQEASGALPDGGGPSFAYLPLGGALLLAGGALVVLGQRRRDV